MFVHREMLPHSYSSCQFLNPSAVNFFALTILLLIILLQENSAHVGMIIMYFVTSCQCFILSSTILLFNIMYTKEVETALSVYVTTLLPLLPVLYPSVSFIMH